MCALARAGRRSSSGAFAWQAWGLLCFKGSDVRFGARGPPPFQRDFGVAGVGLAVLQGVWCTLWRARAAALPAGLLRGRGGASVLQGV